jgi:hypothetical protein
VGEARLDIVHVNAEFAETSTRASDHDPLLAAIDFSAEEPEPLNLAGIIEQVKANLESSDLTGAGRRFFARFNERTFLARLQFAERFEQRGSDRAKCLYVEGALRRVDGDPRPRDEVEGPAATAVADALRAYLEQSCEG